MSWAIRSLPISDAISSREIGSDSPMATQSAPVQAARRRLLLAQAARMETTHQRELGELVNAAALQREFLAYIADCRRQLESLPGRLAGALHGLPPEALLTIETEIRAVLTELADRG